ncbi:TPA: hypothetical protein N0F65_012906 [Lagenidium giganteum]|uniref:Uncharacterized protein n=1 Tax=Lagenidium giganteum TaxID=4803 RepID=A0AAV2YQU2_9STRA|nr:TPA: hypothetical protein N0F65_012906 [Lagenidium giganteum]
MALADNKDAACVYHAFDMAFNPLDQEENHRRLQRAWPWFVNYLEKRNQTSPICGFQKSHHVALLGVLASKRFGLKLLPDFRRNQYDGTGPGPAAIATHVLPEEDNDRVLTPGV